MPLPLLLVPLAVAGGSAVAQAVAKLRAHGRLNDLRAELEQLEADHRDEMRQHYTRQAELCRQLGSPGPELPTVLREAEQPETAEPPPPRWRRLLRRRSTTVADGSTRTRSGIIGRHGASFAAGTVWRMLSEPVLNVARPLSAKLLTFAPRFASVGGAGGSIAASTGLRFALGAVTAVGIILGPALAVWSISSEIRSVRRRDASSKQPGCSARPSWPTTPPALGACNGSSTRYSPPPRPHRNRSAARPPICRPACIPVRFSERPTCCRQPRGRRSTARTHSPHLSASGDILIEHGPPFSIHADVISGFVKN